MPADFEFDAVYLPASSKRGGSASERLTDVKQRFGAKIGPKIWARGVGSEGDSLLTPTLDHALLFPKGHARDGEERFEWVETDADGVKYGKLKGDDV